MRVASPISAHEQVVRALAAVARRVGRDDTLRVVLQKSDPRATSCRPPAMVLIASPPCPVGIRRLACPWANRDSSNLLGERSEMQRSAQRLQHLYRLEVPFTP